MRLRDRVEHLLILALCDAEVRTPRPIYDQLARAFPKVQGWRGLRSDSRIARRAHLLSTRELLPEPPLPTGTLLSNLQDEGVRWQAFHHGVSSAQLFDVHASASFPRVDALMASLRGGGEPLPAVSWIDPDFTRPGWGGSDDHPGGSPARAEGFLAQLYDALRESAHWERSLLWVLWDLPHASRPPLLISPWLAADLEPSLGPECVARSAMDRFCQRRFISLIPSEFDHAASAFDLPTLDAPREDLPRRLGAMTLPEKEPGAVLDDPWQTWLKLTASGKRRGPLERLDAFGERVAQDAERRGAAAERRLVEAGERLSDAGERWISRLSELGDN